MVRPERSDLSRSNLVNELGRGAYQPSAMYLGASLIDRMAPASGDPAIPSVGGVITPTRAPKVQEHTPRFFRIHGNGTNVAIGQSAVQDLMGVADHVA